MKILVVEDDAGLAEVLSQALSKQHYQVEIATSGEAGWELVDVFEYDLVLLDLYLPKLSGIEFCERLRASKHDVPVLLMTAEDKRTSKIIGLDAGADDYMIKPLDLDELLARIRALLRRGRCESTPILTWGALQVDPSSCEVFYQADRLHLSGKQYELLELFLRNPNRIFNASNLIERLWLYDKTPSENAVRSHVKTLRNKLKKSGVEDIVETIYGLGYRLKAEPEIATSVPQPTSPSLASEVSTGVPTVATSVDTSADTSVDNSNQGEEPLEPSAAIWERHQPKYLSLIETLAQALPILAAAKHTAIPSAEDLSRLEPFQKNAHKLKGALGCFGFSAASQLAARIEQILLAAPPVKHEQVDQLSDLIEQLRTLAGAPLKPQVERVLSLHQSVPSLYQWLIIESDEALTQELTDQALIWGIQSHTVTTPHAARRALDQHSFDIVMLALSCFATPAEGLVWLSELSQQQPTLPVMVAAAEDTLTARINVLRSGGRAFLQKSLTATQVLETGLRIVVPTLSAVRILALDDDRHMRQCLERSLLPLGVQLTLTCDPVQLWHRLAQAPPDLLILDAEMPDFDGLELCQIIRSDPRFWQLPILFLAACTEPDRVRQMFEVGGDDCVSKPIMASDLVTRIVNRLERVRYLSKSFEPMRP